MRSTVRQKNTPSLSFVSAATMISENLEKTLHKIFAAARSRRQLSISVDDLLLYLLDDPDAKPVLVACEANLEEMRLELTAAIAKGSPIAKGKSEVDTEPTIEFQRVIQRSIMHVQSSGSPKKSKLVTGANVLVAIFGEKDSKAVEILHSQGMTRLDVVNFIAHGITKSSEDGSAESQLLELASELMATSTKLVKSSPKNQPQAAQKGLRLFVSYSHLDTDCLTRLLVHLKPLEREGLIDCWSDKKIRTGDKWRTQIDENLAGAAVAILLVSADFLASDFIVNNELPPLLMKAEANGIRIIPLILKPCGFHRDKVLQSFQAANDPGQPLLGLSPIEQEALYDRVAEEVHREIEERKSRHARS